ncbi:MAG: hypothetical protein CMH52_05890 [Myxococcales bacterium]|nr:hypothetical protein [Myxococcales bacterium]
MRSVFVWSVCICLAACGGSDGSTGGPVDQGTQPDLMRPDSQVIADSTPGDMGFAQLEIVETMVSFGVTGVGGQERRDVGIINSGMVDLDIVEIEGLSAPFSVNRTLPARIPAGARRTFVFVFEPTDVGTFEQNVVLRTNVDGVDADLSLSGSVETTDGRLVSSEINFGIQQPGQSKSEFLLLENLSESSPITISQVSGIEAPFSVAPGQIPATAAPGERAQVLLNFSPEMDGEYRQTITIRTNAGDFEAQLIGRALAPGAIEVVRIKPAWAPIDEASRLTIYGGPFPADGVFTISVSGQPLDEVERLDETRIRGVLPAMPMAETGIVDVRVENGAAFGLLVGRFILTGPVAEGAVLDGESLAGEIGPDGNPWTLNSVLRVPMDGNLVVSAGTVIVAGESSHAIRIQGQARIGSRDGLVIFSKADRQAWSDEVGAVGGWLGLRIESGDEPINILNTVIEYAGFGGEPAVMIDGRSVVFEALTLQGNQRVGLSYDGQTAVSLVGATLADISDIALNLGDGVSIGQLSQTWTRAQIPVAAHVRSFGRLPIGAGHDWGPEHQGIHLRGSTGTMRVANQPAGVYYTIDSLDVAAVDTFSVPPTVPLKITGSLSVAGTLAITGGGRFDALGDGLVTIAPSGVLSLTATAENRLIFGPDVEQMQAPWPGLVIDGQIDGGFVTIRNGGLELNSDFGQLTGLEMDGAPNPLTINASGQLIGLSYRSDTHPIQITAGEGRITGTIEGTAERDVQFTPTDLCDLWDLAELVRDDGAALRSNCD